MTRAIPVKAGDLVIYGPHACHKGMTVGRAYTVLEVIEDVEVVGHGSVYPYRLFKVRDDLSDIESWEDTHFEEQSSVDLSLASATL